MYFRIRGMGDVKVGGAPVISPAVADGPSTGERMGAAAGGPKSEAGLVTGRVRRTRMPGVPIASWPLAQV